jgi:hypothetical protein
MATYSSIEEIEAAAFTLGFAEDDHLWITGNVVIPLIDIVYLDLDSFYDRLADLLVNDRRLCEIDFDVIGTADNDSVVLRVTGNVNDVLAERTEVAR